MAQTNFTPILTYKSDTASAVPSAGNLTNSANGAELAVNTADKRLFTKDSGGSVVELGTNPSSVTLPNGTANGVVYANGSKVLTTGSALTFDGSALSVGGKIRLIADSPFITGANITSDANSLAIGTGAGGSFVNFFVNNSEQMRLTSTGLGIGTSSPAYKLDVNGVTRLGAGNAAILAGVGGAFAGGQGELYTISTNNMGIGTTGAASLRMYTNSVLAATLDSPGNLGLGVTPSAWDTGFKAFQVGRAAALWSPTNDAGGFYQSNNLYFDGSNRRYLTNNFATEYIQTSGQHVWKTAPSGTAGNAISFTQAMTLDASGNLLVGTTSTSSLASSGRGLVEVNGSTDSAFAMKANNTMYGYLYNSASEFRIANITANPVTFFTNNTERARIDSSGNLIQSAPTTPPSLATNGQMVFNLTSNTNLRVSVRGSDGVTRTANITLA